MTANIAMHRWLTVAPNSAPNSYYKFHLIRFYRCNVCLNSNPFLKYAFALSQKPSMRNLDLLEHTRTLPSVKSVHAANSSRIFMSGYLFLKNVVSNSWSCWLVKCVLCLLERLPGFMGRLEFPLFVLFAFTLLVCFPRPFPVNNLTFGGFCVVAAVLDWYGGWGRLEKLWLVKSGAGDDNGIGGCVGGGGGGADNWDENSCIECKRWVPKPFYKAKKARNNLYVKKLPRKLQLLFCKEKAISK